MWGLVVDVMNMLIVMEWVVNIVLVVWLNVGLVSFPRVMV